jgi:peptide/nickel transport system permease protein
MPEPETTGAITAPRRKVRRQSNAARTRRAFTANRAALIGLVLVVFWLLVALFAPLIAPYGYDQIGFPVAQAPTPAHVMGTDDLGRDVFSRLVYGSRISMGVGLVSQVLVVMIGVLLGITAGFFGGWIDNVIMRFTDMIFAFPALLFALMLMVVLGRGLISLFFAIGLVSWPFMARLVRGQVLTVRGLDYVEAARSQGASNWRMLLSHITPAILPVVLVQVSFGIPQAILAEAFLSFIGIGAKPPQPSWGLMIADGFRWIRIKPWMALYPGLALSLTLLAFMFVGDGLRDALDPHMRSIRE